MRDVFSAPKRRVNRTFIHCSASDQAVEGEALVALIRAWHTDPKPDGRGWADIGYHFVIDQQGRILKGRGLEVTPAAQYGNNTATIAICIHGLTFRPTWRVGPQAASLISLAGQINVAYAGIMGWWPHSAVANKACPVVEIGPLLNLDRWRRMP